MVFHKKIEPIYYVILMYTYVLMGRLKTLVAVGLRACPHVNISQKHVNISHFACQYLPAAYQYLPPKKMVKIDKNIFSYF
jgi:hypothetical protein